MLNFLKSRVTIWLRARAVGSEGLDFFAIFSGSAYLFSGLYEGTLKPSGVFIAIASAVSLLWLVYVLISVTVKSSSLKVFIGIVSPLNHDCMDLIFFFGSVGHS